MGRWTQYDEDEYRLPEGMVRVGYDADTGQYSFRDSQGVLYAGEEGAEYGELTRVSDGFTPDTAQSEDIEAAPARPDGYLPLAVDEPTIRQQTSNHHGTKGAYRSLSPFFLIIAVSLLLVWRLIVSPATGPQKSDCPEKSMAYWVKPGDSCWEIARVHECRLEDVIAANPKVDCDKLMPGTTMCLPGVTVPSPPPSPSSPPSSVAGTRRYS